MTKAKTADQEQPKIFETVDELVKGIDLLKALIKPVDDLKREGNPYKDAERAKTEFQIKDAIRDIFGEESVEYQQYKNFRLKAATKADVNQGLSLIQGLIDYLSDKKLELEGKKPKGASKEAEPAPPATPKPVVSAAPPPAEAPPPPPPVRPSAPSTPVMTAAPPPPPVSVAPPPPVAAPPPPMPPIIVATPVIAPPAVTTAPPPPKLTAMPDVRSTAPSISTPVMKTSVPVTAKADVIALLRKIGTRFHAVVRQLRFRHESRTTLEVEDEYDAQDVVHALLCLEFDEINRETWSPDYAKGATRTDFVLPRDKIAIEVKKTRQGLGAKELTSQLNADVEYYWTHPDCQTLFCFVYDPEGRLGDPHGLEKKLTREIDGKKLEVLISPK